MLTYSFVLFTNITSANRLIGGKPGYSMIWKYDSVRDQSLEWMNKKFTDCMRCDSSTDDPAITESHSTLYFDTRNNVICQLLQSNSRSKIENNM